ncbi:DUF2232 domain-containing protein [uncultured Hoeflea sp.]|uniref:DUF2232 domain-containing protein n=1 Tax=uncultured Hoeflea sp. TaxID=538666 RepID=UPI0030ED708D|tara:strand:- start:6031 stop:7005 length:975 start_codon:yes stop_codon:yes gene_type:complete
MTQQSTSLLVGLFAGVSAALLLISARSSSSVLFAQLSVAAFALPILIAGLGWSNFASTVAIASAMAVIGLLATPQDALIYGVIALAPAAWIAHLSNLARPAEEIGGPEGAVAWYPLSDILFSIAICVCIGVVGVGLATGNLVDQIDHFYDASVATLKDSNSSYEVSAEELAQTKRLILLLLPKILATTTAATWVTILLGCWYVASAIVRQSGRSKRPKDDLPSQLRMPRNGIIALAAGIVLSFVDGGIGLIGWTICGAFGMGFIVAGFAIAHHRTRGRPSRGLLLWIAYLSALFTLPLAFFLFLGLFDTARTLTATGSGPNSNT